MAQGSDLSLLPPVSYQSFTLASPNQELEA